MTDGQQTTIAINQIDIKKMSHLERDRRGGKAG